MQRAASSTSIRHRRSSASPKTPAHTTLLTSVLSTTMSTNKSKAKSKVDALSISLTALESALEPLFAKPLADTVTALETAQQAKLYAALPYLINDLVFGESCLSDRLLVVKKCSLGVL